MTTTLCNWCKNPLSEKTYPPEDRASPYNSFVVTPANSVCETCWEKKKAHDEETDARAAADAKEEAADPEAYYKRMKLDGGSWDQGWYGRYKVES